MGDLFPNEPSPEQLDPTSRWEIAFYEDILRRNSDFVEVLMLLGTLYTTNQMYDKGLAVDKRLSQLRADDPIVHYNLACSYALLGRSDEAFDALHEAVGLGYRDEDHLESDADLDSLRSDPRYEELIDQMRRLGSPFRPGRQ